jgi:protein YIPF6
MAAIFCALVRNMLARWVVTMVMLVWAAWASVPFVGGSVSPARRALAVYPLLLLYLSICWLALVKG